jgi:tRNA(Ile)-lysidine synthase
MVERLIKNIESHQLFAPNDTLLVGVSSGIDSVVLVDLLYHAGLAFAVAHCNFNLRGEESDQDETFVRQLATKYDKPFYCQSFDTVGIASERGISIEMAARDLRYEWFEEIRKSHHYDWIVVAHHRDDQIETFFLNLARGTGISGLTGMKVINGKVIRPLLFATRKEIEKYAIEKFLDYRDDSSNSHTDFQRNKIRHLILPLMEELNPSFREGMHDTISHLQETYLIFNQAIEQAVERVLRRKSANESELSIAELKLLHPISTYLFEILKPYHFNGEVVNEILKSLDGQSGKQFLSPTYRAVLDRGCIVVKKRSAISQQRYYLEEDCSYIENPICLSLKSADRTGSFSISASPKTAMIDRDKLQFPLILRKWQKGDYFQPLGMKGFKKLSDFFVDEKISLPDKEKIWLLTNGEEIVWVTGLRLDDRYKITATTTKLLILELDKAN